MAAALQDLIDLGTYHRQQLGTARLRVIECFSISSSVQQYEELYETVIAEKTTHKSNRYLRLQQES